MLARWYNRNASQRVIGMQHAADPYILEAFDLQQCCPVLQAKLTVDDPDALRAILGERAAEDPDLKWDYSLDDQELATIAATFNVSLDIALLDRADLSIGMRRWHSRFQIPYLIHNGYELPLLLDGRKKLARISMEYPPAKFVGEDRFDHWVAQGVLHREEIDEPFEPPLTSRGRTFHGHRTIYYTPKGEDWRVPAMKLIMHASGTSGGWNEYFERLEGMLFGYEDRENDWWIMEGMAEGRFRGGLFCRPVTTTGMTWIETAGFRALPPAETSTFILLNWDRERQAELCATAFQDPGNVAIVRFNILGRHVMDFVDLRHAGPWDVPAKRIPEINRSLRGSVVVVARRQRDGEHPLIEP
jgi:hypothetical protein